MYSLTPGNQYPSLDCPVMALNLALPAASQFHYSPLCILYRRLSSKQSHLLGLFDT